MTKGILVSKQAKSLIRDVAVVVVVLMIMMMMTMMMMIMTTIVLFLKYPGLINCDYWKRAVV
jgi:hypothetical protein